MCSFDLWATTDLIKDDAPVKYLPLVPKQRTIN